MEVRIKYQDIIDRCEQLSSYESEGKVDAEGNSRYLEIHINEADRLLIRQYIDQARSVMEENMGRMIDGVSDMSQAFAWRIRNNTRWKANNTFYRHVNEALASYAMAEWLKGKLDERVQFYESLFSNSMALATKNILTKQAPIYE